MIGIHDNARLFFVPETFMLRFIPKFFRNVLDLSEDLGVSVILGICSGCIGG